ncbi:MAG TPA: YdeI/OmpD-associated family protein [Anaerolineales bacterium]|nr:YdeI/OmpD-associated family protein [Anaerolineales bacterium]
MPKQHTSGADGGDASVEIPLELTEAFRKEKDAAAYFESLASSHRREYVKYILEAKRAETRVKRAAKTIEMLKKAKEERG